MTVRIVINRAETARVLRSDQAARSLLKRGERVQDRARPLIGRSATGSPPGSGKHLADALVKRIEHDHKGIVCLVGAEGVPHARLHHDDTRPHVIRPRKGKFLMWTTPAGRTVFAREVNHPGTRGTQYLTRAAQAEGLRVVRRGGS